MNVPTASSPSSAATADAVPGQHRGGDRIRHRSVATANRVTPILSAACVAGAVDGPAASPGTEQVV